jgi:phosphatidylinositol alpha-1,6-mannosyltransferase
MNSLKEFQPEVLVVTGDRLVWIAALARLFRILPLSIPWVAVWHGVVPSQFVIKRFTAWAFSQPDMVIAVSAYGLQEMQKMGAKPLVWQIVQNGADADFFHPAHEIGMNFRNELRISSDAMVLLTVGNVTKRKGQDIVIKALPGILERFPNVVYVIAGLPTLKDELSVLVRELGVQNHVVFLGMVSSKDLPALYNMADIFVLTSRHDANGQFEGYGIVVAEAALCSLPSVVSDNSGLTEVVQDNETGFVVPENDPLATALALIKLLDSIEIRTQMGKNARARALSGQTWNHSISQYDLLLRNLLRE